MACRELKSSQSCAIVRDAYRLECLVLTNYLQQVKRRRLQVTARFARAGRGVVSMTFLLLQNFHSKTVSISSTKDKCTCRNDQRGGGQSRQTLVSSKWRGISSAQPFAVESVDQPVSQLCGKVQSACALQNACFLGDQLRLTFIHHRVGIVEVDAVITIWEDVHVIIPHVCLIQLV